MATIQVRQNAMNIYIVEIMCATGYKISDVCYTSEREADAFVNRQIGDQNAIGNDSKGIIAADGTIYRVRPLLLKNSV